MNSNDAKRESKKVLLILAAFCIGMIGIMLVPYKPLHILSTGAGLVLSVILYLYFLGEFRMGMLVGKGRGFNNLRAIILPYAFWGTGYLLSSYVAIGVTTIIIGTPSLDQFVGATLISFFVLICYRVFIYYVERGEKHPYIKPTRLYHLFCHFKYALRDTILGMSIASALFISLSPSMIDDLAFYMSSPTCLIAVLVAGFVAASVDVICWRSMIREKVS